jgi:hypothetical protein
MTRGRLLFAAPAFGIQRDDDAPSLECQCPELAAHFSSCNADYVKTIANR